MLIYWKQRHEELCQQWLTASTSQQYIIYNALRGVLKQMAEIISYKFYSIPFARQQEYQEEVINYVFIKLKEFQPLKGSGFTFCGMVIKQRYLALVTNKNKPSEIKLEYVESYEALDNLKYDDQLELVDVDGILENLLKQKRATRNPELRNTVDLCIQYLHKYRDFDTHGVFEYCCNNTKLKSSAITTHFWKLFGQNIRKNEKL